MARQGALLVAPLPEDPVHISASAASGDAISTTEELKEKTLVFLTSP